MESTPPGLTVNAQNRLSANKHTINGSSIFRRLFNISLIITPLVYSVRSNISQGHLQNPEFSAEHLMASRVRIRKRLAIQYEVVLPTTLVPWMSQLDFSTQLFVVHSYTLEPPIEIPSSNN
tara:strand:- start:178 stop:540 length:363 start_codon:yes stop_codon:yes gene_type:complete